MKRKKTLIILCASLLVICGAIVAVNAVEKHVDSINTIDETVISVDEDKLTSVSWTNEEGEVTFVKEEDEWKYSGDEDFPVSQILFSAFLDNFEDVRASFIIEDVEDYEQYGLADPEHTITFHTEEGDTVITTGTYSTMDEKRYICVDGGTVYLVETDIAENLESVRDDFLDNDKIPYFYQVKNIKITTDETLDIIYDDEGEYIYTTNYDYYLVSGDEYKPVSTTNMNSLINNITNETYTDYVTYKASEDDLSDYGFDDPDLTIYIQGDKYSEYTTEQLSDEDEISEAEFTIYFVHKDDETVYLHVDGSKIIYNFDTELYAELSSMTYDDIRPSAVVSVEEDKLEKITAVVDGEEYTLDVKTDDNSGVVFSMGEKEVDGATVLDDIEALSITEFNSEESGDVVEFSFTLTLNTETELNIAIYRLDDENCLAIFNDEILGYVSRSQVVTLKEDFTKMLLSLNKTEEEE